MSYNCDGIASGSGGFREEREQSDHVFCNYLDKCNYIRQILTSTVDPSTERVKVDENEKRVNPLTAKLFNLNFHPLEVVSR